MILSARNGNLICIARSPQDARKARRAEAYARYTEHSTAFHQVDREAMTPAELLLCEQYKQLIRERMQG